MSKDAKVVAKTEEKVVGRMSNEAKAEVKKMAADGKSFAQIAKHFNRNEQMISNIVNDVKTTSGKPKTAAEKIQAKQAEIAKLQQEIKDLATEHATEMAAKEAELKAELAAIHAAQAATAPIVAAVPAPEVKA